MKNILKILLFIISLSFSFLVNAGSTGSVSNNDKKNLSITNIETTNLNLLKVYLDKDINSNSVDLISDMKLFKDLEIENISQDLDNEKQVNITLKENLEKNTSYSLLPIFGVDGSIDFKIEDTINGLEIKGSSLNGIEKLTIIDSKHLNVIFSNKPSNNEKIDIKILKEYPISKIKLNPDNTKELQVFLNKDLENKKNFLLMVFSIKTKDKKEYEVSNYIYDFSVNLKQNSKVKDTVKEDKLAQKAKIEKLALNSASTPDSGPETWILFIGTFIISTFVYFRKKFFS